VEVDPGRGGAPVGPAHQALRAAGVGPTGAGESAGAVIPRHTDRVPAAFLAELPGPSSRPPLSVRASSGTDRRGAALPPGGRWQASATMRVAPLRAAVPAGRSSAPASSVAATAAGWCRRVRGGRGVGWASAWSPPVSASVLPADPPWTVELGLSWEPAAGLLGTAGAGPAPPGRPPPDRRPRRPSAGHCREAAGGRPRRCGAAVRTLRTPAPAGKRPRTRRRACRATPRRPGRPLVEHHGNAPGRRRCRSPTTAHGLHGGSRTLLPAPAVGGGVP
jgi:hypothetical protein